MLCCELFSLFSLSTSASVFSPAMLKLALSSDHQHAHAAIAVKHLQMSELIVIKGPGVLGIGPTVAQGAQGGNNSSVYCLLSWRPSENGSCQAKPSSPAKSGLNFLEPFPRFRCVFMRRIAHAMTSNLIEG